MKLSRTATIAVVAALALCVFACWLMIFVCVNPEQMGAAAGPLTAALGGIGAAGGIGSFAHGMRHNGAAEPSSDQRTIGADAP